MVDVSLLGTGGMMPLKNRWLSSALMRYKGKSVLFDCGEGTQISIKYAGFTFKNVDTLCLTHLHADHVAGIPGMLLSMGNEEKRNPLLIIGPKGTRKVISSFRVIVPSLPFDVEVAEVERDEETFYFDEFTITAFKVDHRVACYGYKFEVERQGKFDIEKAKNNDVPMCLWSKLQKGEEFVIDKKKYTPSMVLGKKRHGIKIVFSTDTRPTESLEKSCFDADLAILEGMYGDDEKIEMAKEKMHMIFSEAAQIAHKSCVKDLWLTHFSPSMQNPDDYIQNARKIFNNTIAGYDGIFHTVRFRDDD